MVTWCIPHIYDPQISVIGSLQCICQDHLGHKYRSGMQQPNAGSTRARSALRWCPCASCIWLLHPAPILVPKMVLTVCNLRWCFSFHQLAKILHLQSWSSSPAATCAGGVFHWSTSTFTNVRTNEDAHIATCTVWWWWLWWYFYVVVVIVCGGGCMLW